VNENLSAIPEKEWKTVSFVVRFYKKLAPELEEWRGQVEHVQSGEKCLFHGAEQLLQIMECLSVQPSDEKYANP
jgi:hypothetical protein